MMRASSEAADLEKRVGEAQKKDGLGSLLKLWQDAAAGVDSAFSRARSALKKEGTPDSQIDRIEKRIKDIRARSVHFDLHEDLDACVENWKALGLDFAQLSGKQRDPLVQLLDRYRSQVDKATAGLSSALRAEGMLPQDYRELKTLREQRDHAREKYEQLRQKYLAAEKDWQAAEQQKVQAEPGGAAQHTQHGKLPVIHTGGKGPVVVRLPHLHKPRHHEAPPEPAPAHGKAPHHRPHHEHEPPRPPPLHHAPPPPLPKPSHHGKPAPHKPPPAKPFPHRLGVIHPPRMLARHALEKASRAAKVTLEKIDRVGGYPEAVDGIGRGAQSAHIYFRAENIDHALRITGTLSIQLGCGVRLDVAPSVQLFAATPNTPLRGKVSLGLASSGGRLGTLTAHGALEYAAAAAKASAAQVASKLGFIGEKLRSAIADVLEDAAEKIFAHAHSPRPLPPHVHPRLPLHVPRQQVVEHQVGRFGQSLGQQIHHARAVRGGHEHKHTLHKILDHDHHHRATVASRLEETLSHLATAAHRTLTDKRAGEMRGQLARIDSILAKVRGKTGEELAAGAQEIGQILSQIGSIASLKGGAANISNFRKLIDERRAQLMKVLGQKGKAPWSEQGHHLPAAHRQGHNVLQDLRRHHPALDKLLKNASSSHLAQELAKIEKSALHALAGKQRAHAGKHPAQAGGMGSMSLTGLFHSLGGGHLAGFGGGNRPGGLGAMAGIGGALSKVLHKQLEHQVKHARPQELGKLLADLQKAPKGSPLHDVARHAETRRQHHERATSRKGPPPSYLTATALLEAFQEHPKGKNFARHVAKGGALYHLCEAAQRGSGLPVGKMASHYLAARGSSPLYNTVQTFHSLVKEGHQPRMWSFSLRGLGSAVSGAIHGVTTAVSRATNAVTSTISSAASTVRSGISSVAQTASSFVPSQVRNLVTRAVGGVRRIASGAMANARQFVSSAAHHALDSYKHAGSMIWNAGKGAFHAVSGGISSGAHALWNAEKRVGQGIWGGIKGGFQSLGHLAQQGVHAAQSGMSWAQGKVGGALDWAKHKAQTGLEWVKKTGVVGAVGGMLKKGLSTVGSAANWMWKHSPLGIAVSKGWGMIKSSPAMQKIWSATKHYAGKAWEGIKKGYKATANFLQSPAGQLLVTGLSLAASFIPGGLVVKAIIGGAIGAISAISEGKDWKGVLAGAAGGALTGALPFLKIGPLAKIGIGALQGGIGAIASGGNWKDALKGAVGGAVDNFSPGALKSLGKIKGISAAGKLLSGGKLSKAEKAFMQGSKAAGPLRALEKLVSRPGVRGSLAKLEKMGGKAIKGGIWVSGKAAKAQGVLDKVVGVGDQVHGALSQVHDLAPGLSNFLGDNAAGHFVGKLGDWAGEGDDKLSKALEYGHAASDKLSQYRGYLDKGLGYAGVKDPAKAYEKQMARKGLAKGKKGSLEEVARQKLERHKEKHPELHLEGGAASKHKGGGLDAALPSKKPHTALEKAIVKGKELKKKGLEVAQGVHDGLGKVHSFVGKGIEATDKVQHGLEQASALAKQGAGLFGEDSDVGKFLLHA
ncbi:MAG TPA: hypothetical protein VF993_12015, partial [Myxococcales bacterium]